MLIQFVHHPAEFDDLWAGTDYGHDFDCHGLFLFPFEEQASTRLI
jgi:hypothetical protein